MATVASCIVHQLTANYRSDEDVSVAVVCNASRVCVPCVVCVRVCVCVCVCVCVWHPRAWSRVNGFPSCLRREQALAPLLTRRA